jgi:murein hydrolase activator
MVLSKSKIPFVLFLGILIVFFFNLNAQSGRRHLLKKERLIRQISKTQDMLDNTISKQENAFQLLKGVRALVNNRIRLINNLDSEVKRLNDTIDLLNTQMQKTNAEISIMKEDFSALLYEGLKAKNRQIFINDILSSKKFNEAYQKLKLLEKLAAFRKGQLGQIIDKQTVSRKQLQNLLDKKQNRSAVLENKSRELGRLERAEAREQKVLVLLKGKESKIKSDLRMKQSQLVLLESQIIKEIKKGSLGTSKASRPVHEQVLYPDLSPYFEKNKGELPWPANDYIVSGRFGSHQHPDFENITTQNNGIDLLVNPSTSITAVFDGVVSKVMVIPGLGKTVLIKHDQFYTVYANLESIFVKVNSEVSTGERLGLVADGTQLKDFHFELWEGIKKRNPELWLGLK